MSTAARLVVKVSRLMAVSYFLPRMRAATRPALWCCPAGAELGGELGDLAHLNAQGAGELLDVLGLAVRVVGAAHPVADGRDGAVALEAFAGDDLAQARGVEALLGGDLLEVVAVDPHGWFLWWGPLRGL